MVMQRWECSHLGGLGSSVAAGLLFLEVLGKELLVLGGVLLGRLEAVEFLALAHLLAAETLLSDEALNLGGLVVRLITTLDLTTGNVLADVVGLAEAEDGRDVSSSLLEEAAASGLSHDTLLHGETLHIVSTGNFENVAFVFLTKNSAIDLLAHSLLVEGTNLALVIDFD